VPCQAQSTHLPYIRQVFASPNPTPNHSNAAYPRPPYGLGAQPFRFPALAALAGRGQIGGDREIALAAFALARLVIGVLPPTALSAPARSSRAAAARQWLASITVPPAVRTAFTHLADATASNDRATLATALRTTILAAAPALDSAARAELDALLVEVERP
jgi:hypothetical protein